MLIEIPMLPKIEKLSLRRSKLSVGQWGCKVGHDHLSFGHSL